MEATDISLPKDDIAEITTPTTPRANITFNSLPDVTSSTQTGSESPPLPIDPALQPTPVADSLRHSSSLKRASQGGEDIEEMELDDSDDENAISDDEGDNDNPTSRKKKGQRFFCTGYPPCNLSFTRSEHLARHIRKHTGERPFQCHCNRRFSRLDNLRQHAQTVHVNEDIPTDSLAATGTRFQRQIRTDRVRPQGRPRTNTMSSSGSIGRGHSRNTSTSSITSTSSNFSTTTETRRRPPPLAMATDATGRPKLGIEPPRTPPPYRGYGDQSPGGLSTPTSTAYPPTPGSPIYGSANGSPAYYSGRPSSRRLSVPSGQNPFQSPYGPNSYPMPYNQMGPPQQQMPATSSIYASPVNASFASSPNYHLPPGEDWRRRTWHPSSFYGTNYNYGRPATSGLTYSQTPDAPQPAYAQNATAAAGQAPRLPGIESFDHMQHRPSTPPRRQPSPMQLDQAQQTAHLQASASNQSSQPVPRQGHVSWHGPQAIGYTPPQYPGNNAETSMWGHETIKEIQNVGVHAESMPQSAQMGPPTSALATQHPQRIAQEALQLQPSTPKRGKRHGWYNGPYPPPRTSPEDSSSSDGVPTPGTSNAEIHPAIRHSNGFIEPHHVSTGEAQASVRVLPSVEAGIG